MRVMINAAVAIPGPMYKIINDSLKIYVFVYLCPIRNFLITLSNKGIEVPLV